MHRQTKRFDYKSQRKNRRIVTVDLNTWRRVRRHAEDNDLTMVMVFRQLAQRLPLPKNNEEVSVG